MPSQGPPAPAVPSAPSAPEDIARAPRVPAPHGAARLYARERASEDAGAAAVIPIARPPAHPRPHREQARPPVRAGAPRSEPPPAPEASPARRGVCATGRGGGVLRLVRCTGAPVLPFPAATPAAMPSRRPRPPPRVTASATPAVLRTALLVLFAAAAVALIGGRARADDPDAHHRRSAGSRLQPVRFTCDDSAVQ